MHRGSYTSRGTGYTKYAAQIRCVRDDQTSITNTCARVGALSRWTHCADVDVLC